MIQQNIFDVKLENTLKEVDQILQRHLIEPNTARIKFELNL